MAPNTDTIECTLIRVAAAVYRITDMIVFETYKKIDEDKHYLVVILQEDDINESVSVFEWGKVPKSILHIYYYVLATSSIEKTDNSYILYGDHIGRFQKHKYTLMKYKEDPRKNNKLQNIFMHNQIDEGVISDICENMKIAKRLV